MDRRKKEVGLGIVGVGFLIFELRIIMGRTYFTFGLGIVKG